VVGAAEAQATKPPRRKWESCMRASTAATRMGFWIRSREKQRGGRASWPIYIEVQTAPELADDSGNSESGRSVHRGQLESHWVISLAVIQRGRPSCPHRADVCTPFIAFPNGNKRGLARATPRHIHTYIHTSIQTYLHTNIKVHTE
jgi:hypothetical protein